MEDHKLEDSVLADIADRRMPDCAGSGIRSKAKQQSELDRQLSNSRVASMPAMGCESPACSCQWVSLLNEDHTTSVLSVDSEGAAAANDDRHQKVRILLLIHCSCYRKH